MFKGWAVTVVSGLTSLARTASEHDIAWIACGAAGVFAVLDAVYVMNQRAYRVYDDAAGCRTEVWVLEAPAATTAADFFGSLFSWSVFRLYTFSAVGAAVVDAVP